MSQSQSIRTLTSAIASGDSQALAEFYKQWFDFLYTEAQRVSGHGKHADENFCLDMVQDSMLRIIRRMKTIESEDKLRQWLRAVVKSSCYDRFRREQRLRNRQQRHAVSQPQASVAIDHELDERLDWLRGQLERLGPDESTVLTMRFRLGWTLERIGRSLGLKPGAVDGRISRTVSALRRQAPEDFHE